jgi:antitoxin component of MazEF toxin-antitoxin module
MRRAEGEGISTVYAIKQVVPRRLYVTSIPTKVAMAMRIRPADTLLWRVTGSRAFIEVIRPEQAPAGYLREGGARSAAYITFRQGGGRYLKTRIPAQVARQLGIRPGDTIAWRVEEGRIVLRVLKWGGKDGAESTVEELVAGQAT